MSHPVVLVTGCTKGGIGYALCEQFHKKGCLVVATARRVDTISDLEKIGITTHTLDVTDLRNVKIVIDKVIEKFGRIDILVNNAGRAVPGPSAEITDADARSIFEVNVFGVANMVRETFPHMADKRSGTIVNIGSVVGWVPTPWNGLYSASKAAIHAYTDALRMELKPYNIKVMLVAPGGIISNMGNNAGSAVNLSPTSYFKPFLEFIRARAKASQGPKSTSTVDFAANVVAQVLRNRKPSIFSYGNMSLEICIAFYFPVWLKDLLLSRRFGLYGKKL
ncbi:short-chain dehydrogenase/reductase family protein [Paraphysoderma sedebokerense]|nr:short-chain dehydrogenase/reductase family protein [Paraphysoderma sedebokerense]